MAQDEPSIQTTSLYPTPTSEEFEGAMLRIAMILVLIAVTSLPSGATACTIVATARDDQVLVGNNEDGAYPFTAIQILPATDTEYGRICFGFNIGGNRLATLGGVNERGLFVDGNAVGATDWQPEAGHETHAGIVESHVLARFATVDEALTWFRTTNVAVLARGKFLLADRSGASAVVEWSQGALQIIRPDDGFLVSTNFRQSDPDRGSEPGHRYLTAESMLVEAENHSLDLMRSILSATSFEDDETTTLYSYVCDLGAGTIRIYNFHDFESDVLLDVAEELANGEAYRPLPSLFPHLTHALHLDAPRRLDMLLQDLAGRKPVEEMIEDLDELQGLGLATFGRDYTESVVNGFAHALLADGRTEDAITVFRRNVTAYPGSAAACNGLGDAYVTLGDTVQAAASYGESLARDPDDPDAALKLRRLRL
ncbi:MAG: tetratricopeptide repeat protein [bacterium]|nr:tetratricopeptide repeat protein [bacterium]